jgi:hypothetical protein
MPEPQGRDPRLDNSMRCCRQFEQPGRSIAAICAAATGLNSGMEYRADLDSCLEFSWPKRANLSNRTMALSASGALFKIAQIEKIHLRRANEPECAALML